MATKIYDHSKNYTATLVKLPVKQVVEGLDNLVRVEVFGNSCLISKDSNPEGRYLFFPAGCKLAPEILKMNNLYRSNQFNLDQTKKGFFEDNGRVKAIKLKGIISSGFVLEVTDVDIFSELEVGTEFNEIDGMEICSKYVVNIQNEPGTKADRMSKINNKLVDLLIPNQFRFHTDTAHLSKNLHKLEDDLVVLISDKWHGSSCILARVLVQKKLSYFQRIKNKLGFNISDKEYAYICSSGKPKSNLPKFICLDE